MHYEVINVDTGESHGSYETLDEARGCALFDRLTDYEIWNADEHCIVAHSAPSRQSL